MPGLRPRPTSSTLTAISVVVVLLLGSSLAVAVADPPIDVRGATASARSAVPGEGAGERADDRGGEGAAAADLGGDDPEPPAEPPEDAAETETPAGPEPPATASASPTRSAPSEADDAVEVAVDPTPDVRDQVRDRRLAAALERWLVAHPGVGSAAVALVAGGAHGVRWSDAAADPEAPVVLDVAAPYPILSITKTFTEALVLREVERGTLDLDVPMPAVAGVAPVPDGVTITPRMLLQHTSGLVNYMNADGYDPSAPMTPERAVSLSLGTPLAATPGTVAAYSNSNFHWLGLLLEQLTDRSFAELVADLAHEAELPATALDPAARPGWVGFASGGMRSTLPEVASWGAQLFTAGGILSPASHRQHVAVGALGVGLGVWPICPCERGEAGRPGYTAIGQIVADGGLLWFPAGDVVVAVRLAHVPGDVGTMTASLAGALRSALVDPDPDHVG